MKFLMYDKDFYLKPETKTEKLAKLKEEREERKMEKNRPQEHSHFLLWVGCLFGIFK